MQNRTIDLQLFSEIYTNKFENVLTVGSYAVEVAITIKNKALDLWTLTWHNLEGLKNDCYSFWFGAYFKESIIWHII